MIRELTSVEYEEAYLGSLMLDNETLEQYPLTEDCFSGDNRRALFRVISGLIQSGKQANEITVMHEVRAETNNRGGESLITAAWVSQMTSQTFSSANVQFYADSLRELSRLRKINAISRMIEEGVKNPGVNSDSLVAKIESSLTALALNQKTGYRRIGESLTETVNDIQDAWKRKGKISGVPSGFHELDKMMGGFQKQEVVVIGARPGSGKTSLALNIAEEACRAQKRVGIYSCEMSAKALCKRLISAIAALDGRRLSNGLLTDTNFAEIADAGAWLYNAGMFVDDTPNIMWADLVSNAKKMKRQENIDLLIVDYLGLINTPDDTQARHEQVGKISKGLKQLARELDIPIIVLSQLTRDAQGKRPNLAQLRESGSVEQDADVVILLWVKGWADETSKEILNVTMIVEKSRNSGTGDVHMAFKPSTTRFRENEKHQE